MLEKIFGQLGKAKKILIVEDDRALARALVNKFSKEKFQVKLAVNGKEGLKFALKYHPDLILLDIIMPEMDGLTMLNELRKDKWGKTCQAIILSNLSEAEKTIKAMESGVYDYLVKTDWTLADVVKKVKEKLK